jgi:type I restriction enzyme R subunit
MTQPSESQTRQDLIDIRLKKAGWNVNDAAQVTAELDIWVGLPEGITVPQHEHQGHQYADYVLLGSDGYPLAVVEAKKTARDARVGQEQALQYAENIRKNSGKFMPFVFYTNGHDIYFWDTEGFPPRKIYGFPKKPDLERLLFLRENKKPLSQELINRDIADRPYQIEAIRSVLEGIEKKKRQFLLVMATGTGKTRTTAALMDVLMRANSVQRILFLVDRVALRNQALDAFKEYLPNAPIWPKQGEEEIATNRRIYTATYPTMLNIIEDVDCPLSPHFFDLIIADESHRSIYNVYKNIFDYFDSVQLGLTATPTDAIEHNTFGLFACEDGMPTYAYSYEQAVNNKPPYLCDFRPMVIRSKFQKEGIHKANISIDEQKKLLADGKEPEEINYEGTDLEKKVTNKGTNALIVQEFMEECIKDESGTLPGKTIFFAMTQKHAYRLQEIFDNLYPEQKGNLAKVITSDVERVHGKGGLLDQFTNSDFPRIAISVDMLDTGIDVREIVNLVFVKPVFSYTKFWQMIGRGTRLLEPKKIKPWCKKKDVFLIMDCWNNFEYFQMNPKGREDKPTKPMPVRLFEAYIQKHEAAEKAQDSEAKKSAEQALQASIEKLPKNNVIILDAASSIAKLDAAFWQKLTEERRIYLQKEIAPLMRARTGDDFKAMSLEIVVTQLATAKLQKNAKRSEVLMQAIIERVSDLPSTNIIAKQKDLIEAIISSNYLENASESELQKVITNIAPLMKHANEDGIKADQDKLNLRDITLQKEFITFGPKNERMTIQNYREKMEELVRKLEANDPILRKIRAGESLTREEVNRLADTLGEHEPYPTEENLQKAYDARRVAFLDLIKHIMGLGELKTFSEKVTEAFDTFITTHNTLTTKQIQFLTALQLFIIENGSLSKKDLTREPFTRFHAKGFIGLFKPREQEEILKLTDAVLTYA